MGNVRNFLDASTGHLSPATREWLSQRDGGGLLARNLPVSMRSEYGWLLWVPDIPHCNEIEPDDPWPDDLLALLGEARKENCDYVLCDADADYIDGPPCFDDGHG